MLTLQLIKFIKLIKRAPDRAPDQIKRLVDAFQDKLDTFKLHEDKQRSNR